MLRKLGIVLVGLGLGSIASAQQPAQPQVKVNMLNVCSPSPAEQQEIGAALAKIPRDPAFSIDFEVSRGRSSLESSPGFLQAGEGAQFASESSVADYVRIRRELPAPALFSTVQYSFSTDPKNMVETLVLRMRDPKDLMEISIEDSASNVTSAATMLSSATPASRIKLERFGKSSIVLARCPASEAGPPPDQSAYEPLFRSASRVVGEYRKLLKTRSTVPEELAKLKAAGQNPKASIHPAAKRAGADKK